MHDTYSASTVAESSSRRSSSVTADEHATGTPQPNGGNPPQDVTGSVDDAPAQQKDTVYVVDWDGPDDPDNPKKCVQ